MCSFSHSEQVGRAHCGWVLSKISKMSRQNSFKRCLPWCRLQFPHFLLHLAVARDATIQALIVRQLHIMLRGRLIQPCFAGDQRTLLHFTFTSLYFLKDSLYIRGGLYRDVTNATRQVHGYTLNKMWWTIETMLWGRHLGNSVLLGIIDPCKSCNLPNYVRKWKKKMVCAQMWMKLLNFWYLLDGRCEHGKISFSLLLSKKLVWLKTFDIKL